MMKNYRGKDHMTILIRNKNLVPSSSQTSKRIKFKINRRLKYIKCSFLLVET